VGKLEIGAGQIKDIKEVNKQKQNELNAQREKDFNLDQMFQGSGSSTNASAESKVTTNTGHGDKNKGREQRGGFEKGSKMVKDGIAF